MKNIKKLTVIALMVMLMGTACALSPHSPTYGLYRLWEGFEYFFAGDNEGKARIAIRNAERRMEETELTTDEDVIVGLTKEFEKEIMNAEMNADMIRVQERTMIMQQVRDMRENNIRALERVIERVPEAAKNRIQTNIERQRQKINNT